MIDKKMFKSDTTWHFRILYYLHTTHCCMKKLYNSLVFRPCNFVLTRIIFLQLLLTSWATSKCRQSYCIPFNYIKDNTINKYNWDQTQLSFDLKTIHQCFRKKNPHDDIKVLGCLTNLFQRRDKFRYRVQIVSRIGVIATTFAVVPNSARR